MQQGNAETGFFTASRLERCTFLPRPKIQERADAPGADAFGDIAEFARAGDRARRCGHGKLADLFLERHRGDESVDAWHGVASQFPARGWFQFSSPVNHEIGGLGAAGRSHRRFDYSPRPGRGDGDGRILRNSGRDLSESMTQGSSEPPEGGDPRRPAAETIFSEVHGDGLGFLGFAPAQQTFDVGRRARRSDRRDGLCADQAQRLEPAILQCADAQGYVRLLRAARRLRRAGGILLVLNVAQTWLNQTSKVALREGFVHDLLNEWLAPLRAFRLSNSGAIGVNPDQRIRRTHSISPT